jgi:hypothetical protein
VTHSERLRLFPILCRCLTIYARLALPYSHSYMSSRYFCSPTGPLTFKLGWSREPLQFHPNSYPNSLASLGWVGTMPAGLRPTYVLQHTLKLAKATLREPDFQPTVSDSLWKAMFGCQSSPSSCYPNSLKNQEHNILWKWLVRINYVYHIANTFMSFFT